MKQTKPSSSNQVIGQVLSVSGQVAEVEFLGTKPELDHLLIKADNPEIVLFVAQSLSKDVFYCYILNGSKSLARGDSILSTGEPMQIPVGDQVLAQHFEFSDLAITRAKSPTKPLHLQAAKAASQQVSNQELWPTGIKVIDFFTPLVRGGSLGLIGGAGVGKTMLLNEILHNLLNINNDAAVLKSSKNKPVSIFAGVGERAREGHELVEILKQSQVFESTTLVTGAMGANAALRFLSGHAALTMAEYFRDQQERDVVVFVDNIFRFAQAGNELSILTQVIPSEDGYQADLDSQMAQFHQKLYSTTKASMSSIEAVYVPADDLLDGAVQAVLPYLDSLVVLSRDVYQQGLMPALDLLSSSSTLIDPNKIGTNHHQALISAQALLKQAASLERMASLVGESELSPENQQIYQRAKKLRYYMTQPFHVAANQTGRTGVWAHIDQVVQDVLAIIGGKLDQVEADKLLNIGTLESIKN